MMMLCWFLWKGLIWQLQLHQIQQIPEKLHQEILAVLLMLKLRKSSIPPGVTFESCYKLKRNNPIGTKCSPGSWVLWAPATSPRTTSTTTWISRQNPRHTSSPEAWAQSETGFQTKWHCPDLEYNQNQSQVRSCRKLPPLPVSWEL